jgi:hypothetical protein
MSHNLLTATPWANNLWGMVAIGLDGNVCASNASFEHYTAIPESSVLGMSEADFNRALSVAKVVDHRRVEATDGSLRAIYYFSPRDAAPAKCDTTLVAEALREPLTSIYGLAELLLKKNYAEETRVELLTLLLEEVNVLSSLITVQLDQHKSVA